jgi:hypothetical protein
MNSWDTLYAADFFADRSLAADLFVNLFVFQFHAADFGKSSRFQRLGQRLVPSTGHFSLTPFVLKWRNIFENSVLGICSSIFMYFPGCEERYSGNYSLIALSEKLIGQRSFMVIRR